MAGQVVWAALLSIADTQQGIWCPYDQVFWWSVVKFGILALFQEVGETFLDQWIEPFPQQISLPDHGQAAQKPPQDRSQELWQNTSNEDKTETERFCESAYLFPEGIIPTYRLVNQYANQSWEDSFLNGDPNIDLNKVLGICPQGCIYVPTQFLGNSCLELQ